MDWAEITIIVAAVLSASSIGLNIIQGWKAFRAGRTDENRAEIEVKRGEFEILCDTVRVLDDRLCKVRAELAEAEEKIKCLERQNEKLTRQLVQAEGQLAELKEENLALKARARQLEEGLAEADGENSLDG